VKSISYQKFADRFLTYTHRGEYQPKCITDKRSKMALFTSEHLATFTWLYLVKWPT